jgi:DNA-binding CsgD family transcriptional regulator
VAVLRLSRSDLEATLGFLRQAHAVSGPDPFPTELLDALRELVASDFVGYCELDRVERRFLYAEGCAQARQAAEARIADSDEAERIFWSVIRQSPIYAYHERTGDFAACMLSDFMSLRALRGLDVYTEFFRPAGIEYRLAVGLPAPLSHTKTLLFDRGRSRDFGERDRLVLDRLRPHLTALYAAARERRRAAALELGRGGAGGLVVLQSSDRIDFLTPAAARLLIRHFGSVPDGRLPSPVRAWLRNDVRRLNGTTLPHPATEPLRVQSGDRRLTIRRAGRTLLLDEQHAALTRREREIVDHLAEGRSNAEIAERLTIAPTTVRKHLENIYAKLGVRSRTAAVAATRVGAAGPGEGI